ncbi:MAG: large repetitive protein, partial [Campylobacterota bacterium]|nr:large repetitive protein [Campylobacterota bacterium]
MAARSVTQSGEVFLGGDYLEIGIGADGGFGTVGAKPDGFYGTDGHSGIGLSNDIDGFGAGSDLRIDYFLPGTPEERWSVGYNGITASHATLEWDTGAALTNTSLVDDSSGDTLGATFTTTIGGTLLLEQKISFGVDDKFFKNEVTITNLTEATLTDVRFMRSFDPDNTVYYGGNYTTINTINHSIAEDDIAVVSAQSLFGDPYCIANNGSPATILLYSSDPRAFASAYGFTNTDPYVAEATNQQKGYTITTDGGIGMTLVAGNLAAGASTTFTYYTSLDAQNIDQIIEDIQQDEEGGCPVDPQIFDGTTKGDKITATDCSDIINGFAGNDIIKGEGGNDIIDGGEGSDKMYGGKGSDIYYADRTSDFIIERADEGEDSVITTATTYTLTAHIEDLTYEGEADAKLRGNQSDNIIISQGGNDSIFGGAGNDGLCGNDGNDIIDGGTGADVMKGG